ncbi:methyltransferase family protein [Mycobacterium talmoniae]|uniref:Phospholipid methyltransferase n=1 Tax=Mycobacterium talmoniae TaxID=1858794 RepID=A0A1S1NJZ1_9MYCO|nr:MULTISPECIES: methyltransferase [Mycobacterium]OHV04153.1 hypothetical protein BKN37_11440 [Mycobacterium talmoniae]TDH56918.1 hypothetical protein E2F47_04675 [Mycobacterium eburneum]
MTTGLDVSQLRGLAAVAPAVLAGGLWLSAPTARLRGAAFLAALWNVVGLLAVNAAAVQLGWWAFGTVGSMWAGVPVDVIVGWAVLWGAVPVLMMPWVTPVVPVAVLLAADVLAMDSLQPLVVLRPNWWWGEALAVAVCLLPGVVLGVATAHRRMLRVRATLQVVLFAAVVLFVCPTMTFALTGTGWAEEWHRVGGPWDMLWIQAGAVVAIIALRAVADFVHHGGTPFPWDPPPALVTGGPYAYLANPMQVSGVALLLIAAAVFGEPALVLAAGIAAVFSGGIAGWSEREHLRGRFGDDWIAYRRAVRDWLPRWHPCPQQPAARLYVAASCEPCRDVGSWLAARRPAALRVVAAEHHPGQLRRIRYEAADGTVLAGIRAVGAALAHVSLGYAVLGWLLRAPGLSGLLQLLADAVGAGPRGVPEPS